MLLITLVFIIGALWFYRDHIFESLQDPGQPFQTYEKPAPPNYSLSSDWLAIPSLDIDPFKHPTRGDVFVVVPGVYKGGEHWNVPVDDERRRQKLERIVRPNYVAPYKDAGRLFAPHYRYASLYTFMTSREDARWAQNFAYQDVKAAFEEFLKHSPPERPIVLAGHDQGASHVQRLLVDYFQGELSERLAVAYIIGHPLPLEKLDNELAQTPACEDETDTGCIVAYGAFMPNDEIIARRFVTRLKVYNDGDYEIVDNKPLLCTNPLLLSLIHISEPTRPY